MTLKLYAINQDRNFADVIEEALTEYFQHRNVPMNYEGDKQ